MPAKAGIQGRIQHISADFDTALGRTYMIFDIGRDLGYNARQLSRDR